MLQKTEIALLGDFFVEHIKMTKEHNMPIQHYHDMYEIYLHIDGDRDIFMDTTTKDAQYFHLTTGDLYIIEPFVVHYTQSTESISYERYVVNFKETSLQTFLEEKQLIDVFKNIHTGVIRLEGELFEKAYEYFKSIEEYSTRQDRIANRLLYSELFQFIDFLDANMKSIEIPNGNLLPKEIIVAMNYIKEYYRENITLERIIQYVHMSKSSFCHKFKEFTGTSLMEYVYTIRISIVHRLLKETDLPIYKIAEQTGFSSAEHMNRLFKKFHNLSPSEFRKNIRTI